MSGKTADSTPPLAGGSRETDGPVVQADQHPIRKI